MTAKEMVKEYLRKNNYNGLVQKVIECHCELDNLFPCKEIDRMSCVAEHKKREE